MIVHNKPTLWYILAPSYSGSTLLTLLLAQHKEIATVGELNFDNRKRDMDTYVCSCGDKLKECAFWKNVSDICAERGVSFSVENFDTTFHSEFWLTDRILRTTYKSRAFSVAKTWLMRCIPGATETLNEKIERIYEIGQAIRLAQNGEVLLDASKHPGRLYHFMQSGFWDIKVIYLTRDGRGVTRSNMSNQNLTFNSAMKQWRRAASELHRCWNLVPETDGIHIKYEDLCSDPTEILSRIYSKFGMAELNDRDVSNVVQDQHILGNRMRLTSNLEVNLDEKWRSDLSRHQLAEFDRVAGRLNLNIGYD